jgi:S-adenosylmethionine synthetase
LSCIGRPIAQPRVFDLKVRLAQPRDLDTLMPRIAEVAHATFGGIGAIWREAVEGTLQVW